MHWREKMSYLRMDLKVCEGCGTLWLRACALDGVYCRSCRARLSEFPLARGRRVPLGPRKKATRLRPAGAGSTLTVVAGGAR
jgi:hypothetical protein